MTEQKCPRCGAESDPVRRGFYACGAWDFRDSVEPSMRCLTRQLAQRDEFIAALRPVVRAAMEVVRSKYDNLRHSDYGAWNTRAYEALEVFEDSVVALTPEQRARIEEADDE